jgi:cell division protein FtsI/penicillin-binding protein 2
MKRFVLFAACLIAAIRFAPAGSLAEQSIAKALERAFPQAEINYLLLDARSGNVVAARWPHPDVPLPAGSLVKPFTALAYFQANRRAYPQFRCRGAADGCWNPSGHGRIGMAQAIEFSCNAYFRQLAAALRPEQVAAVARLFGIEGPPASARGDSLFGLGDEWRIAPLNLVRAYAELSASRTQPGASELIEGMALAARNGTAAAAGNGAATNLLAKTGTAPCAHEPSAPGDGFALLLYPADSPRLALLVRWHGRPGAEAAAVAGRVMRTAAGRE